jgi:hypothetical protein
MVPRKQKNMSLRLVADEYNFKPKFERLILTLYSPPSHYGAHMC